MGIKGLTPFLNKHAAGAVSSVLLERAGPSRRVAVDATLALYQFMFALRDKEGQLLADANGKVTSHIQGTMNKALMLSQYGLSPCFVFDGVPPLLKAGTLSDRSERREGSQLLLDEANANGDSEAVAKYTRRVFRLQEQHMLECMQLLSLLGVPNVRAPSEAEAQCAQLARDGAVYAVFSEDMDTLCFGSPRLWKGSTFRGPNVLEIKQVSLDRVLEGLDVTMDQFIEFCILCGCDYTSKIKGVGPVGALKLIKAHGSIQHAMEHLPEKQLSNVPAGFDPVGALKLFVSPHVLDSNEIRLDRGFLKEQELIQFLVDEKSFSGSRVEAFITSWNALH